MTSMNLRRCRLPIVVFAALLLPVFLRADDVSQVRDAVKRSTLDQPGTKPFHLKAVLAPTHERDRDSGRTGEVEIWWASPTRFRREVRSPEFHQIEIVDGEHRSQKNDGSYFPIWLYEISVELIKPVPELDAILELVDQAEVKSMMGTTHFSWIEMSTDGRVEKGMGGALRLTGDGLLDHFVGLGWYGSFHDYQSFHGRMVARSIDAGSPEVTAKVTTLEDLRDVPVGLFDPASITGDEHPIDTVTLDEVSLRKNLQPTAPVVWPPMQDGPLEGGVTTEVVLDREGKLREIGTIVSDNPGINKSARETIAAMQFKPYVLNGQPVQVISRITMPFKTTRPAGSEVFDSARSYFVRGRKASFLAANSSTAYTLHAQFEAPVNSGEVTLGQYEDTWLSDTQWRRDARIGNSRYVRSRNGENYYQFAEGPDAPLLQLVLKVMEPIPAIDTFVESDWKIKRDPVDGVNAVRVLTGYESPEGHLDPVHARGYWFNEKGELIKTHFHDFDTIRSQFEPYEGTNVAREIDVRRNGALGMRIRVTDISPTFELKNHEWTRAFTGEVR